MKWDYKTKAVFNIFQRNIRIRHYSPRSEKSFRIWINKFRYIMDISSPYSLKIEDVKRFLSQLAIRERASASTQN